MTCLIKRHKKENGNNILEFALVAMPTVLTILGVAVIGVNLGRSVQVTQICRDAGGMYVRGLDFSLIGNQQVVVRLGQSMNLQLSGGDGLVILSKVTFVPDPSCGSPPNSDCTSGKSVLLQRITFGNTTLLGTHYVTVGAVVQDSQGNVSNYSTDPNAVISTFATAAFQMRPNEVSYVAETYFRTPDVSMPGFQSNPGIYSQAFF